MTGTGDLPIDAADQSQAVEAQEGQGPENHVQEHGGSNEHQDHIARLEQQNRQLAEQHDLLKRVMLKQQQEASGTERQEKDENDDEYITKREAREWYQNRKKEDDRVRNIKMDELLLNQQTGDYFDVVKNYSNKAFSEDPDLRDEVTLMANMGKNAASYLYKRCKNSKAYQDAERAKKQSKAAQSVARNADRPPSLSQMGKAGGSSGGDYWTKMSSSDFKAHVDRICNEA